MQQNQQENRKKYCKEVTKDGTMINEKFWTTIKPFLTDEGNFSNNFITIKRQGELIRNRLFYKNFANKVEISSGYKLASKGNSDNPSTDEVNPSSDEINVKQIVKSYSSEKFNLPETSVEEINKIVESLNTNTATGPDRIPAKNVKLSESNRKSFMYV